MIRSLVFALFCSTSLAGELLLTDGGKPTSSILLPPQPSEIERYAADELRNHLKKISGAELPLTTLDEQKGGIVIAALEGNPALAAKLGIDPARLEEEEVIVRQKEGRLWLVGKTPAAALYATYTFLQDRLGCRWYWPGPEGEHLPEQPTIRIGEFSFQQRPSLKHRTLSINSPHYDEATDIWMARQRLNRRHLQRRFPQGMPEKLHRMGFQVSIGGHNLTVPPALLEKHPEYAAEIGGRRSTARVGRRQPHLCWSNAGLQEALITQTKEWLRQNPAIDIVTLSATDHTLFCECSGCVAMAKDVSTRWQLLCGAIIKAVREDFPDQRFWSLAYQSYRALPSEVAPLDNVMYCAYNANYLQPLTSAPAANAEVKRDLLAWQKLGVPVSLRGYDMIPFSEPMWTPLVRYMVEEKRWLRDHGFAGSSTEVAPYGYPKDQPEERQGWTVNRMALYAAAQALWNADLTAEALLEDWMKGLYGPAAESMHRYYRLLETAWLNQTQPLTYFLHPPTAFAGRFLSMEVINEAQSLFAEARKLSANDPRALRQLELEARMFGNWRTHYLHHQNKKHHYQAWAAKAPGETLREEDWSAAPLLPPFEDRKGIVAAEPTEVRLLWTNDALLLRVACNDTEPDKLLAKYSGHDENLFSDDSIELFVQWEPEGYAHLAFNSAAARYDTYARPESGFDPTWNPDWKVTSQRTADGWTAEVTLPFAALGAPVPKEGSHWKLAIKRNRPAARRAARPELKSTGWPDASYHNRHSFGEVHFVSEAPRLQEVVLYHGGTPSHNVQGELLQRDYRVTAISHGEAELSQALAHDPALVLIRYGNGKGAGLSPGWFGSELRRYLENGGRVVLAASGNIRLEQWFGDDRLEVQWSGWTVDRPRRTSSRDDGDWMSNRNDLAPAFQRRIAPASAYRPIHPERWKTLASLRLQDQSECPYLMSTRIGRGTLYLTSSNMGYSGGAEIFGRFHPGNVAALLENLMAAESL